jgi:hypothetical protein
MTWLTWLTKRRVRVLLLALLVGAAALLAACATLFPLDDVHYFTPDGGDEAAHDANEASDASECVLPPDADTRVDSLNCGRCGHSCLGGPCSNGGCQPYVFASGFTNLEAVVLSETDVYWGNSAQSGIFRCAKTDCPDGGAIFVSPPDQATHITLTKTDLYFANYLPSSGGSVKRCALDADRCGSPALIASADYPSAIALLDGGIYFLADEDAGEGGAPTAVYFCPGEGCDAAPFLFAHAQGAEGIIAIDDALYWREYDKGLTRWAEQPDAQPDAVSPSGETGHWCRALAADRHNVYFTSYNHFFGAGDSTPAGGVYACPVGATGCGTTGSAPYVPVYAPQGLALDSYSDSLYVTNGYTAWDDAGAQIAKSGSILRIPLCPADGGCTGQWADADVLAANQDRPKGIAVDRQAIYWTVQDKIMRLAK